MPTAKKQIVMVRSRDAGVFYGTLIGRDGQEVTIKDARRVWYWDGAATLSELSQEGPAKPRMSKFPAVIEGNSIILGVCEVLPVTDRALKALDAVPVWSYQ